MITAAQARTRAQLATEARFNNTLSTIMTDIQCTADKGLYKLPFRIRLVTLDNQEAERMVNRLKELGYDVKYDTLLSVSWNPPLDVITQY